MYKTNEKNESDRDFVHPVIKTVNQHFTVSHNGLDFGADKNPVLTKRLSEFGYTVFAYDPLFHSKEAPLERTYENIICCLVIDHFYNPRCDFLIKTAKTNWTIASIFRTGIIKTISLMCSIYQDNNHAMDH